MEMTRLTVIRSAANWTVATAVAAILLIVAASYTTKHTHSGTNVDFIRGKLAAFDARLTKLESQSHPATSKRFNSDDAALLEERVIKCLEDDLPIRKCVLAMKRLQEKQ